MKVEDSLTTIVQQMKIQQMKSVCKPMQRFLLTLSQAFVCVRGRSNFRNLARYVPFCEHTISRQFGKKFDFSEFACLFFDLFFPKDTFIVALDATFIPKSGKHTFGKDKFFSSTQGKAVGGLELSLLSLISIEKQTAFSFQLRQSWTAVQDKLVFYLEQIEKVKISLLKKTTFLVADGYYAKHAFVEGICQMEFTFISKLRSDANLRWLYQSQDSQPQDSPLTRQMLAIKI